MTAKFDNVNRNRYYGLRIGDIVKLNFYNGKKEDEAPIVEVIDYGYMDNNRVYLKFEDGTEISWVAEWCTIIKKVEDK